MSITALSTPASNRIILDANDTVIKIQSTNGEGFYFRVKIYVNDVLFDTQGWSRSDAFTAEKNLKNMLQAYYTPVFSTSMATALAEQSHLLRKVKIIIEEYSLNDVVKTAELELPVFSVMYCLQPDSFSDTIRIRFLGVDPEMLVIPVDGKIAIPFYVNVTNQLVSAKLETDLGTAVHDAVIPAPVTGKKVYLYKFDLSTTTLSTATTTLKLTLVCGTLTITKQFRIQHLHAYPFKELAFRNNYGYYLFAYPSGEMESAKAYDIETYETASGQIKASAITQETTYTINSGNYSGKEVAVFNMLAMSVDPKINLVTNTIASNFRIAANWKDLTPKTKKHTAQKDRQHSYNDELVFTLRPDNSIANTGMIWVEPAQPDMLIDSVTIAGHEAKVFYTLNNGFNSANLRLQYRPVTTTSWVTLPVPVTASPVTFRLSSGNFAVRLIDFNDQSNASNIQYFTIA